MKKLPLNIQFFAEDPNEDVMTPSDVLNKLMGSLPIEEWADEFDILQKAIANEGTNMTTDEDYQKLKDENEKLAKSYDKLTEAYKKRFGELTEEKIENTLGRKEENKIDYRNIDMSAGFYGATE